jgi:hypothetical protein
MCPQNHPLLLIESLLAITFSSAFTVGVAAQPDRRKSVEEAAGFVSIFNGKDLTGWRAAPKDCASDWSVRDGVIVGIGSADRLAYLVWREEDLADFELKLSYRLRTKGNTGVEIRSRVDTTGKRPFEGYHADLGHVGIGAHILGAWDFHFATREEYPCPRGTKLAIDTHGKLQATKIEGALTPADVRQRQWNHVHIIARGRRCRFTVNGKPASEFIDNMEAERLKQGAIGLQIHDKDMRVEFKDIWLKRAPVARPGAAHRPRS